MEEQRKKNEERARKGERGKKRKGGFSQSFDDRIPTV